MADERRIDFAGGGGGVDERVLGVGGAATEFGERELGGDDGDFRRSPIDLGGGLLRFFSSSVGTGHPDGASAMLVSGVA